MVNNININNKEIGIDMKDSWYNYSPEVQKLHFEEMSMIDEISHLHTVIKRQNDRIRELQNQSLISIVKDRFNKWFFGTK